MLKRTLDQQKIGEYLKLFPVTAILGARQTGKTTLARQIKCDHFFDLENPRDLAMFGNPQLLLEDLTGLVAIDEIQRKPDLFPLLRYLVDANRERRFLVLGSASRDLIRQSSETLAGRIGYFILEGFRLTDVGAGNMIHLWQRGGFPLSYCAESDEASRLWRDNFITTFLERDIPQLGIRIPAQKLRRFWTMLSNYHGQLVNYSEIGRSFDISDATVRHYIDILAGTFMARLLMPWHANVGKRLVKSPKVYIKDPGLFHRLINIDNHAQLLSHPKLGASWEGFALEQTCRAIGKPAEEFYFYRTHAGAELDLFWQAGGKNYGAEFKYSDAPVITKSMRAVVGDLELDRLYVVYPGAKGYALSEKIEVVTLEGMVGEGGVRFQRYA